MQKKKKIKVLISASGTAGHLIPACQISDILEKKDCEIIFAASDLSKKRFFEKSKFKYFDILSSTITKKSILSLKVLKILFGFFQSLFLILKQKPNIVVGFGSYHTFPVLLASFFLKKKIILFESNLEIGKVNSFFSKKAKYVATQFDIEKNLKNKLLVKRFPWTTFDQKDDKTETFRSLKLNKNLFTLLVFGGSQGSDIINLNFLKILKNLKNKNIQVIHILGGGLDIEKTKKIYEDLNIKAYVSDFEKSLFNFYKISDLVISRSGACSILEFIHFEKPSILIPFKGAKNNHQYKNALYLQNTLKSSKIIPEDSLNAEALLDAILFFLENDKKHFLLFKKNIQNFKMIENDKNKIDLSELVLKTANSLK